MPYCGCIVTKKSFDDKVLEMLVSVYALMKLDMKISMWALSMQDKTLLWTAWVNIIISA